MLDKFARLCDVNAWCDEVDEVLAPLAEELQGTRSGKAEFFAKQRSGSKDALSSSPESGAASPPGPASEYARKTISRASFARFVLASRLVLDLQDWPVYPAKRELKIRPVPPPPVERRNSLLGIEKGAKKKLKKAANVAAAVTGPGPSGRRGSVTGGSPDKSSSPEKGRRTPSKGSRKGGADSEQTTPESTHGLTEEQLMLQKVGCLCKFSPRTAAPRPEQMIPSTSSFEFDNSNLKTTFILSRRVYHNHIRHSI